MARTSRRCGVETVDEAVWEEVECGLRLALHACVTAFERVEFEIMI